MLIWGVIFTTSIFMTKQYTTAKCNLSPRCRGIPRSSSASSVSITPFSSPILSRWTLIVMLYISCDCNHIPTGAGLGWGCAPQMAKEYFPFRWTQLTELLKEFSAGMTLSHSVSFMLILLCVSLLLCICTSLSLHPSLCLSSSLSNSQTFSGCLLFPPPLSLNKLVCHSTFIAFSYLYIIWFYFSFFLAPWHDICLPSILHSHVHTHAPMHTSPSLILSILSGSAPVR